MQFSCRPYQARGRLEAVTMALAPNLEASVLVTRPGDSVQLDILTKALNEYREKHRIMPQG
ncbi:hypothetical protein CK222_20205 [Mesorhizobium sp. WSM3866]|nr:hypothetical protein CK222_20205 [Mesorhizobium sp. WSM3866]